MKSRKRLLIFLVSVLLFTSIQPTWAAGHYISPDRALQMQREMVHLQLLRNDPRYQQTLLLCQNDFQSYGSLVAKSASEMILMGVLYTPAWIRAVQNHGIAPEVKALMESEHFQQALLDCGKAEETINKMAWSDLGGKILGVAATYAIWRSGSYLFLRLGRMGRAGAITQKVLAIAGLAYAVDQSLRLAEAISDRKKTEADVKEMVNQASTSINQDLQNKTETGDQIFRREIATKEEFLNDPNLSLEDRAELNARITLLKSLLNP